MNERWGNSLESFFEETRRSDRGIEFAGTSGKSFLGYDKLVEAAGSLAERWLKPRLRDRFLAVIWMESTPDFFKSLISVVLAGGIPVPMHAYEKPERVLNSIRMLEAEAVLVSEEHMRRLRASGLPLPAALYIDGVKGQPAADQESGAAKSGGERAYTPPAETALILMTSGSTGNPKGVMLSAENILSNVQAILRYTEVGAGDRILLGKSPAYGSTLIGEWLLALAAGAQLTLTSGFIHPLGIIRQLREHQPTFLCTVPSAVVPLVKSDKWTAGDAAGLRVLLIVGGAMPPEMLIRLQARLHGVRVMPSYGLTEAAPRVTYLPPEELERKLGSAGIPVDGVRVLVLQGNRPAPPRVTGEIVVQSPGVMIGYYKDPLRTAAVLGPHGLHTSDLGYLDEEGFLYINGRKDNALNVGGHTIYPEAVEQVLSQHAGVEEAAVAGRQDPVWGHQLCAFIVPSAPFQPQEELIRSVLEYCRVKLPPVQEPREVRIVARLPRTGTGKLDRAAVKSLL